MALWGMAKRSMREVAGVARCLLGITAPSNSPLTSGSAVVRAEEDLGNATSFEDMLGSEALVLVDSGDDSGEDLSYMRFRAVDNCA